jgi:hypothetical protein
LKGSKRICGTRTGSKVTIGVIFADPSYSVKVIRSEAKPPGLPKVSRCKRENKSQGNTQPEIG